MLAVRPKETASMHTVFDVGSASERMALKPGFYETRTADDIPLFTLLAHSEVGR